MQLIDITCDVSDLNFIHNYVFFAPISIKILTNPFNLLGKDLGGKKTKNGKEPKKSRYSWYVVLAKRSSRKK